MPHDWPNRDKSRLVQLAPHRWHVQQMGEGPDALLLHGAGASAHSWAPIIPMLQGLNCLFVPDLTAMALPKALRDARDCLM